MTSKHIYSSQDQPGPAALPDVQLQPEKKPSRFSRIAPAVPIILFALVLYSSRASFALRPRQGERLLPLMMLLFFSSAFGGWFLQSLSRMASSGWKNFPRSIIKIFPLAAVLLILPFCSAFGYEIWLTCEPLRYLAAVGYGLMLPCVNYTLFSQVKPRRRGLWFGLITSIGMLTWWLLTRVAVNWEGEVWQGFPPGLRIVYIFHTIAIVLLAWSLWRVLLVRPCVEKQPYPGYFDCVDPKKTNRNVILLLTAGLAICLMNGFIEAKLFPVLLVNPKPIWPWLLVLLIVLTPFFGWHLDQKPDRLLPTMLKGWGWCFILDPSLIVLGEYTFLYRPLHVICSIGQVALLVVLTIALAGFAKNAWTAAALTGLLFSFRILALFWARLLNRLPEFTPGTAIVFATLLAFLYYQLAVRVKTGVPPVLKKHPEKALQTVEPKIVASEEENTDGSGKNLRKDAIKRFLAKRPLTPREYEIGILIMNGETSREIGAKLGISEYTVNSHVKNLLDKFGVSSRRALFALFTKS